MASIRDMSEAEVMQEPEWPRCGRCGVDLVTRVDGKTGRPVTERGRDLLECPGCGELEIAASPARARRRFRMIRAVVALGGIGLTAAAVVEQVLRSSGPGSSLNFVLPLILIGAAGCVIYCAMEPLALALSPNNRADVRFTAWALVVFWGAAAAGLAWVATKVIWPPKVPGRQGPPATMSR
jgi:hypothetical protein